MILLMSGSTRAGSTNSAAVRALAGPDAPAYDGLAQLPAFVPGADGPAPVEQLRSRLAAADAVLFCTPEYAGTLPGSLKNALDWVVGSGELDGKPVGSVNVAAPGRGDGAQATLRLVLSYVNARIVEPAWTRVQVPREAVGESGELTDPAVVGQLVAVLERLRAGTG